MTVRLFLLLLLLMSCVIRVPAALGTQAQAQPVAQSAAPLPAQAPATARAAAPIDLSGYWVSLVTNEWRWRMLTPAKGDYAVLPINAAARKIADSWDPARDEASGEQCKSYGAAVIMQVPTRLHVTWENDNTMRIDTDAGTQNRRFQFGESRPPAGEPTWQGYSVAEWQVARGRGREATSQARSGTLKVVTTRMRPGYLRKNGVPYSGNAVVTEYFSRVADAKGAPYLNGQWLSKIRNT